MIAILETVEVAMIAILEKVEAALLVIVILRWY
jgi:hypothetical protein